MSTSILLKMVETNLSLALKYVNDHIDELNLMGKDIGLIAICRSMKSEHHCKKTCNELFKKIIRSKNVVLYSEENAKRILNIHGQ